MLAPPVIDSVIFAVASYVGVDGVDVDVDVDDDDYGAGVLYCSSCGVSVLHSCCVRFSCSVSSRLQVASTLYRVIPLVLEDLFPTVTHNDEMDDSCRRASLWFCIACIGCMTVNA